MKLFIKTYGLYIAWLVALVATAASLFFSEVMKFPPCILCWYQRIFMYPLVIIFAVGILRKETKIYQYVLPMVIIGGLISIYHNLLYFNILPESAAPCTAGISCTTKYIEWFGFITIPFLSLVAFAVITVIMLMYRNYQKETTYENI